MLAKVLSVSDVHFMLDRMKPPGLYLFATGTVNSGGWSGGQLVPRTYIRPPDDGILDFDLVAERPATGSVVIQVISEINAHGRFWPAPSWFKGVRVHSSTNFVEGPEPSPQLEESAAALQENQMRLADDRFVPFPGPMARDPGDAFPWTVQRFRAPERQDQSKQSETIGSLIGKTCRTYHEGDPITMDYLPDRVNIVLAVGGNSIVNIYFG